MLRDKHLLSERAALRHQVFNVAIAEAFNRIIPAL
jgi:hypothetical protein